MNNEKLHRYNLGGARKNCNNGFSGKHNPTQKVNGYAGNDCSKYNFVFNYNF